MKTINENRETNISKINFNNLDWGNDYHVLELVSREIDNINDCLIYDYNLSETDFYDALHEIIDSSAFVIYNYKAQRIATTFDVCPFSESPITGEKYNSWNQIAYEVIEQEFMAKYGDKFTS